MSPTSENMACDDMIEALEWVSRCLSMPGPAGTTPVFISRERMDQIKKLVDKHRGTSSMSEVEMCEHDVPQASHIRCLECRPTQVMLAARELKKWANELINLVGNDQCRYEAWREEVEALTDAIAKADEAGI